LTLSLVLLDLSNLEDAILLGRGTGLGDLRWPLVQDMKIGLPYRGLSALIIGSAKPRTVIDQTRFTYADQGAVDLTASPDVSHIALGQW
jgi:hypothetical protein